mmetsp:Transcript_41226/g.101720  ORF Transcript_41226/g.101720 Transcript_41226/m.101720 type:complete len:218 (-) Transcript_41226:1038-1691(-)
MTGSSGTPCMVIPCTPCCACCACSDGALLCSTMPATISSASMELNWIPLPPDRRKEVGISAAFSRRELATVPARARAWPTAAATCGETETGDELAIAKRRPTTASRARCALETFAFPSSGLGSVASRPATSARRFSKAISLRRSSGSSKESLSQASHICTPRSAPMNSCSSLGCAATNFTWSNMSSIATRGGRLPASAAAAIASRADLTATSSACSR